MKRREVYDQMRKEDLEAEDDEDDEEGNESVGVFKRASAEVMAGRKIIKIKRAGSSAAPLAVGGLAQLPQSNSAFGQGVSLSAPTMPAAAGPAAADGSERDKKVRKLNESFLRWAETQIETHPLSIWKDGVKDYIKHYEAIEQNYGADNAAAGVAVKSAPTAEPPKQPAVFPTLLASKPATLPAAPVPTPTPTPASAFPLPAKPAAPPAASVSDPAKPTNPFGNFTFSATATATAPPGSTPAVAAPAPTPAAAAPAPFAGFSFAPKTAASAPAAPAVAFAPPAFAPFTAAPAAQAPAPAPAPAPAAAPAAAPFSGFTFGAPPAAASEGPKFGGFGVAPSFGGFGSASAGAPAAAAGGGGEDEEGGDDEGEPILEPEKVLRNAADTDEILHEVPCKLFSFSAADKEWKDTGKGTFRITRDAVSKKQRMLVRNQVGRINFNAAFFPSMKVEKVQKRLKFAAFVTVEATSLNSSGQAGSHTELKNFMIQVKAEDLDATHQKLEAGVASAK